LIFFAPLGAGVNEENQWARLILVISTEGRNLRGNGRHHLHELVISSEETELARDRSEGSPATGPNCFILMDANYDYLPDVEAKVIHPQVLIGLF
jgi:hypothetical protein